MTILLAPVISGIAGAVLYVLGWVLSVPRALRRVMLVEECPACAHGIPVTSAGHWMVTEPHQFHRGVRKAPRGSFRDRNGADVASAMWRALFWPVRLLVVAVSAVVSRLAGGVSRAVIRATPLTVPEMERRAREQERRLAAQAAEIERLSAQIASEGGGQS